MNKLMRFSGDDGDEIWLFADLFASLLMTVVMLVNAQTVSTQPKNTSNAGKNDVKAHLIYLIDAQTIKMDQITSPSILMSTMIKQLQTENSRAEVVVRQQNNGVQLFDLFAALDEAEIDYSYSKTN